MHAREVVVKETAETNSDADDDDAEEQAKTVGTPTSTSPKKVSFRSSSDGYFVCFRRGSDYVRRILSIFILAVIIS